MKALGRVLAIEAGIGAMVAGALMRNPFGWTLLALGLLVVAFSVLKVDKRAIAWLEAEEPLAKPQVINAPNRNGPPVGVIGDGQGFTAVLEIDTGTPIRLPDLTTFAATDPSGLAGTQVLIEQFRGLTRRVWIVLRHEPMWAQEAVFERGGGAEGARAALVAAAARLQVLLGDQNLKASPLSSAELSTMFTVNSASHCCLRSSTADWQRLLQVTASAAEISYISVIADEVTVRLVSTDPRRARDELLASGIATEMGQRLGLVATLPLGGGARNLVGAIGLVRQ
ncbi:hypothetical protein LWC34_01945 [Kibdelosporangium philippinense]|uniref:Type VII secretion system protein EccE domain-containing protein n=1 Tax=Kibdelosporangium philippinense TaxID=211113 RepID=A0ABS8Z175_9PSEU|nr:type VII secretion protein EccE [Kibdelosporangium philippinense]MCE7001610.1 hypothetical protein [Kibdelosporangium philippinense]